MNCINFPKIDSALLHKRIQIPEGHMNVVLDTDTFNEIDDQFAVTMALLAPEKMDVLAITAAPFLNEKSVTPADGMEKSYQEILRLLKLLKRDEALAVRGSETYLPDRNTPVNSDAALKIIQLADECAAKGEILHILAFGAITNVASALLLEPELVNKISVVWLGGHPTYWKPNNEFNFRQDIPAAQVLFSSGVPLIQIPCVTVASSLLLSRCELEKYCEPCGAIGKFLAQRVYDELGENAETRIIWDISTVGICLCDPNGISAEIVNRPTIADDGSYVDSDSNPEMLRIRYLLRDYIFRIFFDKLKKFAE